MLDARSRLRGRNGGRWRYGRRCGRHLSAGDQGEGRADGDLGSGLHQKLIQNAVLEDLHLDGAFLSFHHSDDVAPTDRIARPLQPLNQRAGLHVGAERWHDEC